MTTRKPIHHAGSRRKGFPIQAAAVPLGIYIAVYAAVWGLLRVLTSGDADAAVTPASAMVQSAAAAASTAPASVDESPPSDLPGQILDRTDSSRECSPVVIDSNLVD
jgi:hypothetical protein